MSCGLRTLRSSSSLSVALSTTSGPWPAGFSLRPKYFFHSNQNTFHSDQNIFFSHSDQNIVHSDKTIFTQTKIFFTQTMYLKFSTTTTCREFISKHVESIATKIDPELDIVDEIERQVWPLENILKNVNDPKAASGRLLFLLDGLDEITGVASLSRCALNITIATSLNINVSSNSPPHLQLEPKVQQRGHPHSPRADSGEMKHNLNHDDCDHQAILAGRLAPGAHVIVTSRPHTLTYLQVPNCHPWFRALFLWQCPRSNSTLCLRSFPIYICIYFYPDHN